MANVSFNITNTKIDLVARNLNYQATIEGEPNPQTKGAFVKEHYIKDLEERALNQAKLDALAAAVLPLPDIT